ncbi:equilibrative nucleoside transporter 1 isoform X1 [Dromiciops gliroides]|uniref:equilibrative nucleoside transporter 1 isoform X1 n=1 Tax=Dromiciops gliroides TaxID=33562 RepID=UPI001CC56E88|nr:equilibrative nucleoside transporter 1 isoform X1 [Dromiciops gliroides]XP_043818639.1 equilibrative nucleoside transporter 1 isoform X1 [Dromiciops gliroides]XP_043818640.1 equilibrative nucleoside transporter 1 isoform X1 [Dromiciops gliroides]XP_043818641.1 equilibrative nucleoside transporter 1 isoform X1 [Dromiciops gliroides]XP_043818642.1 equilibrative nucleoside transporter 1 isoform X1 [Dromiciops gliroides]XP_043818643.1 equilibrative nucleoside transporter 1 isoform X1 [Dromiciop
MTTGHKPQDRYRAVWLIFFMLGLGTLLPWNFFMTATMYFKSRLGSPQNNTSAMMEEDRIASTSLPPLKPNFLDSIFNNVMTICAMLPLLVFTCLNSFLHQKIPQALRILGSLVAILLMFAVTATLVKVDLDPMTFFILTMVKIVIINSFGAILQGSLFGLAGLLPASYTVPIMSGQGLAGTFAAIAMICAIASGSKLEHSAFGYFITACGVIVLSILCYLVLPRLKFYQYYQQVKVEALGERETKMDLIRRGILPRSCKFDTSALSHTSSWLVLLSSIYFWGETEAQKGEGNCPSSQKQGTQELEGTSVGGVNSTKSREEGGMPKPGTQTSPYEKPSIVSILKQIWVLALSVCFVFTVTIGVFPSVTAEVQSTIAGTSDWKKYFIPVSCFFTFNVFDWAGRSLTTLYMWPKKDSQWQLPALVLSRILFVPLFMLCNVHPRNNLPVIFHHDAWFIIFMIFFAFSNGYLASLCMCFGPKKVKPSEAETAGTIMAFFLSLGLALGALLSFLLRAIV